MMKQYSGFTLLEMLVVLVIIGLLAGLVGTRLFSVTDAAKVRTAETQVKMLKGALETMRLDIGRFPNEQEGLALLRKSPSDTTLQPYWRGPYLDEEVPNDPWNTPYQYTSEISDGRPFSLYSFGADGKQGGKGDDADIGYLPTK